MGELRGIEVFAAGTVLAGNQEAPERWTVQDLADCARNFALLARRDRPLLVPQLKVGHEDAASAELLDWSGLPSFGRVSGLEADAGREPAVLRADFADVPDLVMQWVDEGRYTTVSVEIDREDSYDPNLLTACAREGITLRGPVLSAVALLGAAPPAVKDVLGLRGGGRRGRRAALACAARPGKRRRYFSEVSPMDPTTLDLPGKLDWLDQQGYDTAALRAITDPAQQEAAVNAAVGFCMKAKPPGGGDGGSDQSGRGGDTRLPSKVALTFSDADRTAVRQLFAEVLGEFRPQVEAVKKDVEETRKFSQRQAAAARRQRVLDAWALWDREGKVAAWEGRRDDKTGEPVKGTPLARLLKLAAASHFAEGAGPSDLDEAMAEIEARPPRQFSERIRSGAPAGGGLSAAVKAAQERGRARHAAPAGGKTLEEKLHMLPAAGRR